VRLDSGEDLVVTVGPFGEGPPVAPEGARRLLDETEKAWRSWVAPLGDVGGYRSSVERSLLAMRSLTGPGGAPAAAGTASIPRRAGTDRTADDRWISGDDVSHAVSVFAGCGLAEDAESAEAWLRRMVEEAP